MGEITRNRNEKGLYNTAVSSVNDEKTRNSDLCFSRRVFNRSCVLFEKNYPILKDVKGVRNCKDACVILFCGTTRCPLPHKKTKSK